MKITRLVFWFMAVLPLAGMALATAFKAFVAWQFPPGPDEMETIRAIGAFFLLLGSALVVTIVVMDGGYE